MIYKEKVKGLLTVLEGKIRIIEAVANGAMQLSNSDVLQIISDIKKIREQIEEIIDIER
jgi:predicted transcriptional regulator